MITSVLRRSTVGRPQHVRPKEGSSKMLRWWQGGRTTRRRMTVGVTLLLAGLSLGVLAIEGIVQWCPPSVCGAAGSAAAYRGKDKHPPGERSAAVGHGKDCAVATWPSHPQVPRPGYLVPFDDPLLNTRTIRVTDPGREVPNLEVVWAEVARHHYSLTQAWNADQTLLMLDRGTRGQLFLDGATYKPLFRRDGPGESRWHSIEPDLQIFVRDNLVGLWNVRSDEKTIVAHFPAYSKLAFGPSKGSPSDHRTMIALAAKDSSGRQVAFAYDVRSRKKYPDIDLSGSDLAYVSISPLGDLIVFKGKLDRNSRGRGDQTRIFDLEGNQVGPDWPEYGRPSHFDLTIDENGDQVAIGVSKSDPDKGRIIKRRLQDGHVEALTTMPGAASHVSARSIRRPGWVYVTYGERPDRKDRLPYEFEVVALRTDGSQTIRRLARTYAARSGYVSEAHASPSPDGSKVIWASNWGQPGDPISAFVTEIEPGTGCTGIAGH
jgi:hypothetical protein